MDYTSKFVALRKALIAFLSAGALASCSNIDCPLDNQVVMTIAFFDTTTEKPLSISDSLSVFGLKGGQEEILFNRGIALSKIALPLNQAADHDTLLLVFHNDAESVTDTLFLQHSRHAHFESIDCPVSIFHQLQAAQNSQRTKQTSLPAVERVLISNPNVNYEDVENLKVFLRPAVQ